MQNLMKVCISHDRKFNRQEMEMVLDNENFLLNDDPELERETQELLQWAEDLNFDKYLDDWFFKSTVFVNFDSAKI
jgi:hypothetical protein